MLNEVKTNTINNRITRLDDGTIFNRREKISSDGVREIVYSLRQFRPCSGYYHVIEFSDDELNELRNVIDFYLEE